MTGHSQIKNRRALTGTQILHMTCLGIKSVNYLPLNPWPLRGFAIRFAKPCTRSDVLQSEAMIRFYFVFHKRWATARHANRSERPHLHMTGHNHRTQPMNIPRAFGLVIG